MIHRSRRGFSLVLSLTIMALLVLVVLTIAGFLNLESRLSSAALSHARARMNAVTAARLALGQLQQLAGHDQRVTARADLLDPAANGSANNTYLKLATLNDQRRWWTGVWVTGGANGNKLRDWDPASPDKRLFAGWLVSPQGTGQGLGSVLDKNLTSTQSDLVVKQLEVASNGTRGRVTMLGGESLPTGTTLAGGRVESDVAIFPTSGGGYAWWTADEGIKARVNLSDPLAAKGGSVASRVESSGVNDWWRGFAGVAVGRVGVELAGTTSSDTGSIPSRPSAFLPGHQASREAAIDATKAWTENPILRVFSREELQAWLNSNARTELDAATKAASIAGLSRGWHDLTVSSRGVLSNQLDGGLKVDLSVAFELPFATTNMTFAGVGVAVKGWQDLAWFHQSPDSNSLNLAGDVRAGVGGVAISSATDPQSEEWNILNYKLGFVYEIVIPAEERNGRGQSPFLLRGPTWDLLRNHYRLYKREREAASIDGVAPAFNASADAWLARGSEPYTFVQGSPTQLPSASKVPGAPAVSGGLFGTKSNASTYQQINAAGAANYRHQSRVSLVDGFTATTNSAADRPMETRARLSPSIVRVGMVHSLIYVTNTVAIGIDPFVVLHNPYNVPIEFVGLGVNWAQFNNTRYNIYRSDSPPESGAPPAAYCTLGQDAAQRSFSYRTFGTTPVGAWKVAPTFNLRMLPGETQVVTPALGGDRWQVMRDNDNTNVAMGAFEYDFQSNFRINAYQTSNGLILRENEPAVTTLVKPAAGATYSDEPLFVDMTVGDQAQYNAFQFYLFRTNRYGNGNRFDLGYRAWLGNSLNPYADCSDEHLLQQINFRARPSNLQESSAGALRSQRFLRYAQIDKAPVVDPVTGLPTVKSIINKNFFAITDLRLRSAKETNGFPMATFAFNPRAEHADPRNLDDKADTSPAWTVQIRETTTNPSLTEFQLQPGTPNGLGRNLAAWGSAFEPGSATTPVILFQVPTRPLLSIAQLAHADISQLDIDPAYPIGNSYALPWLDSLDKIVSWPSSSPNALERVDIAYAANLGLWDRTFFSGFNAGTASEPRKADTSKSMPYPALIPQPNNPATGKQYDTSTQPYATVADAVDALFSGKNDVLANRRMTWSRFPKAAATASDALLKAEFVKPEQTAKQLVNEGAFNVNSTSVAAWKAQLASGFQALANGTSNIPDYPFGRMQPPTGESVDILASGNTNRWNTFRSLKESDGTLTKLAEAIVAEVRARGPFMSLSDFVNRRLATDRNGQKGALQAAIDAVSSPAINASVNSTQIGSGSLSRIPQAAALSPTGNGADTPLAMGRPDQLLQSDVLAALGPGLAARSDTFVIRAYGSDGDARGSAGQAWCEITVQRLPEWVVPSAEDLNTPDSTYRNSAAATKGATVDTLKRNTALGAVNRQLGRRFAIVSFRWVPTPTQ